MLEECTCRCHHNKGIKHTISCCTRCHICKKRIRRGHWLVHMAKCDPEFKKKNKKIRDAVKKKRSNV